MTFLPSCDEILTLIFFFIEGPLQGYVIIKKGGHKCHFYCKLGAKEVFCLIIGLYNNNITFLFLQ